MWISLRIVYHIKWLAYEPIPAGDCGNRLCQLCFVVPIATGAPWQAVEFTGYLEPTTELIMPCARTIATAGDLREAT